jgi:regulator of nonsense transcripts 1
MSRPPRLERRDESYRESWTAPSFAAAPSVAPAEEEEDSGYAQEEDSRDDSEHGRDYNTLRDYSPIFRQLLDIEREAQQANIERPKVRQVAIAWRHVHETVWEASFTFPVWTPFQFSRGDFFYIRSDRCDFGKTGSCWQLDGNTVSLRVFLSDDDLERTHWLNTGLRYDVFECYCDIPFRRQVHGLHMLVDGHHGALSPLVERIVLGQPIGDLNMPQQIPQLDWRIPCGDGYLPLDDAQRRAVMTGLSIAFSLVQGPPGTGKTSTIAALCWQLVQLGRRPILVSAPANVTVEHLTCRISELGQKVYRMAGAKSDRDPSVVRELTVYHMILQMRGKEADRFRELDKLRHTGTFDENSKATWFDLRWKLTRRICRQADIVCCTPDMAGAEEFSKLRFRYVVCDESTKQLSPRRS